MRSFAWAGIAALHRAYAAGEITPPRLAALLFERIDHLDPKLHAFIELDRAVATAAAAESAARIASGNARTLEGVPVAIKANIAVAGLGFNAGMEARREIIADIDAETVSRLRGAGAIILGTLNMHEAALGATTDNRWFGRAANPHDTARTPGGSSGGSGAAVAAGLAVAALGTDTLGSVRIPASYNGVYGLKPTTGTISDDGLVPLSKRFDTIGPLARSLDDLETISEVLAGMPACAPIERIALLDALGGVECEAAVIDAYRQAIGLLADLPIVSLALADSPGRIRTSAFIAAARELAAHLGADRPHDMRISEELRGLLDYALARDAVRLAEDDERLRKARLALWEVVTPGTVLLMPTAPQAAFRHGETAPVSQADFCALASVAGLPSLSIPAGFDNNQMPVGVQLVGAPGSERALFTLARTLDAGLAAYRRPQID